jgi:hypothetical protein
MVFAAIVAAIAFAIQFIYYQPNGPILALILSAPLVPVIDTLLQGTHYRWTKSDAQSSAHLKGVQT